MTLRLTIYSIFLFSTSCMYNHNNVIGTSNNIVQVTANTSTPEHATVECQFLTQLPASCEVCYGDVSNCHNMTCLLPVPTNADGIATVILPNLEEKLKYCYTAAATVGDHGVEELALVVQGSFSTGKHIHSMLLISYSSVDACSIFSVQLALTKLFPQKHSDYIDTVCDVKDLVHYDESHNTMSCTVDKLNMADDIIDLRCTDSEGSLPILNGVVCYNGSTSGSTAYYICNGDYQVPGYSDCKHKCNLRECQGDGHWSGETIPCLNGSINYKVFVQLVTYALFLCRNVQ